MSGPWTPVDAKEVFEGPGKTNAVSGGTAAFYKVELKEPHPVTGSKGHYIAKDLAHAVDEVNDRGSSRFCVRCADTSFERGRWKTKPR